MYLTNCPKSFQSTLTIERGFSDFRKPIVTALKVKYENVPPKIIHYRDYKIFDSSKFFEKLQLKLSNLDMSSLDFGSLKICFMELLNKIAPLKTKFLRANHSKFVKKDVSKAIMLTTILINKFLKKKTLESRAKYNKQRNIVSLIKKAKPNYYENLDLKDINGNKKFWVTVKPLFSNKIKSAENIYLDESGEIIRNEKEVANVFNKYFANIVPNIMGITNNHNLLSDTDTTNDPIEKFINKFQNHPSITSINKHMTHSELTFLFQTVTKEQITNLITLLNNKKAIQSTDIPTTLIKEYCVFFSESIHKDINLCIAAGNFVDDFKQAEVRPFYKKHERTDKSNYRPISILFNVPKIYERSLYNQLYDYFDKNIFSKYQCAFRKGFNTQHALLVMLEKMKIALDRKGFCVAVLKDLSKAFDCICHDLLIAKLNAYGLEQNALKLVYDVLKLLYYLSNRSQKTKVGSSISTYLDIVYGVPQGSILGPLLFNIDLCDLFFENYSSDFSNYADDTTSYECGHSFNVVINNLEATTEKVFEWFSFNNFKANTSKFHLFVSPYEPVSLNFRGSTIESSSFEKLLGIFIDSSFTFEYHINRICRKTSQNLHALCRISKYNSGDKKQLLFKSFIISQFNYCPIVWMCHGRRLNNKINNLHERN